MNLAHAGFSIGVVATSLSIGIAVDRGATPLGVLTTYGIVTVGLAGGIAVVRPTASWGPTAGPGPANERPPTGGLADGALLAGTGACLPSALGVTAARATVKSAERRPTSDALPRPGGNYTGSGIAAGGSPGGPITGSGGPMLLAELTPRWSHARGGRPGSADSSAS